MALRNNIIDLAIDANGIATKEAADKLNAVRNPSHVHYSKYNGETLRQEIPWAAKDCTCGGGSNHFNDSFLSMKTFEMYPEFVYGDTMIMWGMLNTPVKRKPRGNTSLVKTVTG